MPLYMLVCQNANHKLSQCQAACSFAHVKQMTIAMSPFAVASSSWLLQAGDIFDSYVSICLQQAHSCYKERGCWMQGFGNVGAWAAEMLHVRGGRVLCVSDRDGAMHNENGLDIPALRRHLKAAPPFGGSLLSFPGGPPFPLMNCLSDV